MHLIPIQVRGVKKHPERYFIASKDIEGVHLSVLIRPELRSIFE